MRYNDYYSLADLRREAMNDLEIACGWGGPNESINNRNDGDDDDCHDDE